MTREIGFLIFEKFQLLDAAGPIAAFEIGDRHAPGAYRLHVLATRDGRRDEFRGGVDAGRGARFCAAARHARGRRRPRDLRGNPRRRDSGFVREAARVCRRVASVCSGAFILAEAGVLDGRRATTHWSRSQQFAMRYPRVRLEADRIFVRDGAVWSSAGITAGIDLALALIADDLGEVVARRTAQQLVVYRRRPGGQSQFSALLEMERPDGRFGPLLGWARERLGEPLTVDRLADRAGMSSRNFARRFAEETGMTPARAVERLRVERRANASRAASRRSRALRPRRVLAIRSACAAPSCAAFGQAPQALRRAARAAGS